METPQSILSSSRSRKCSGDIRAKRTRLGWQRIVTLELGRDLGEHVAVAFEVRLRDLRDRR